MLRAYLSLTPLTLFTDTLVHYYYVLSRNLSHAIIACTVIMYYYKYTVLIPTGKRSYQEWKHHIRIIPGILFSGE